jgi:hypothetical protein
MQSIPLNHLTVNSSTDTKSSFFDSISIIVGILFHHVIFLVESALGSHHTCNTVFHNLEKLAEILHDIVDFQIHHFPYTAILSIIFLYY